MANKKKTNYNNPNRKTRSYIQIIYEESAPPNFVDILKAEVDKGKLRYFILSPWHDRDWYTEADEAEYQRKLALCQLDAYELTNPVIAGTYKKKHLHMIGELAYNTQQYYANKYFQGLTNGSFVKPRENLRGAVRYHAHLDEDPRKKAMYDPDLIYAYGDIKIDRFLQDEDKSMNSLTAWKEIKQLIIDNNITNYKDFDDLMDEQDIDLQLQFQKNARLASRAVQYINSKREQEHLADTIAKVEMNERALKQEKQDLNYLVEHNIVTVDYAQAQLKKLS